jgi:hypothetical protein
MKLRTTAGAIALAIAAVTGSAVFAADSDSTMKGLVAMVDKVVDSNGMVAKKDFMPVLDKRWNQLDKTQTGMISRADLMRIFRDDTGQ